MNRIDQRFHDLKAAKRKALVSFITAGDPDPAHTVALMHELVAAGTDIIELGVPFSDPMADGPVIQKSSERAVARGIGLSHILAWVAEFRSRDTRTPVVLMGYLNPTERYGYARFAQEAAAAGVDGVLLVDSPVEESADLRSLLTTHGLHMIFLAAPTTTPERLQRILDNAQGFLYYVSIAGVTGAGHLATGSVGDRLDTIRARTGIPVCVGFGIKDAASASALAAHADGIVIGSALVERLAAAGGNGSGAEVSALLGPIRTALDACTAA